MNRKILVVDDDSAMCDLLRDGLISLGFDPALANSAEAGLQLANAQDIAAVVTDLNLGGTNGIEFCRRMITQRPNIPVVVITAFGSMEAAIAAIRAGAYDFITKPFEITALGLALERALQHRSLSEEVTRLRQEVRPTQLAGEILGSSEQVQRVRDLITRIADSEASVLIGGESGTGKELVARALHQGSHRSVGPFVAINCSAFPESLLESELFGATKGAFTDARTSRPGLLFQANGGTLFLDEIGDLPLALQPKLLRALQERKVRPLGGGPEVPFDCRLVSATNRDLEAEVGLKHFREDLYFRINVVEINLPPLRIRGGDVIELAQRFVEKFAVLARKQVTGITSPTAEVLLAYDWPGNIRELENCIQRAVALTSFDRITPDDLTEKIRSHRPTAQGDAVGEMVSLEEMERRHILGVLRGTGNNRSLAAQILGVDRRTLYRKLDRYEGKDTPPAK